MSRIDKAASFLFPNRCCGCGKVISADEELCRECVKARVHFCYGRGFCDICGQKRNGCICTGRHFFNKAVFAFFYSGKVKNSVRSFKFRGRLFYGRLLAKQMFNAAEESGIIRNASVIIPIPMHPLKKLRRGYNQAEVLAKELSKLSGVPYANALQKLTFSGAQHDLGMLERTGNVAATFEVKRKYTPLIENANVILVDDIMTTHATLNEAAKTLLIFGADSVNALAAAAAPKKKTAPEDRKL